MKHLYAMQREDGAVKVGISNNSYKRAVVIKSEVGQEVEVSFFSDARSDAKVVETVAHKLLKEKQANGEWFRVSVDEATAAIALAVEIVEGRSPDVTLGITFSTRRDRLLREEFPSPAKMNMQVDDAFLLRVDRWRVKQGFPVMSRSEAVRRMVTNQLDQDGIEP